MGSGSLLRIISNNGFCACVQEKSRLINARNHWWVEQTDWDSGGCCGLLTRVCVICSVCSQQLSQHICQLLSELEENRGFHFMQRGDDMEQQGIDEKARSVYHNTLLQLDLVLGRILDPVVKYRPALGGGE